MEVLVPIAFVIFMIVIMGLSFGPMVRRSRANARLLATGSPGVGRVVSVAQTGVSVNDRPQMRIAVATTHGDASPRVEAIQILDLGQMPRPGDEVDFVYDPATPGEALLTGIYFGEADMRSRNALGTALSPAREKAVADLRSGRITVVPQPDLRPASPGPAEALPYEGELRVAEVIDPPSRSPEAIVNLELDAIGRPRQRAVARPLKGAKLEAGDRLYVLVDPDRPDRAVILPPEMTGGQTLPRGANRLDVLVLGPQLLKHGALGAATVRSADPIPMAEPKLAVRGYSKWKLALEVSPEQGQPYRVDLPVSCSTPEKAARLAHAGAEFPIRYDPLQRTSLTVDSLALGWGDPYAEAQRYFSGEVVGRRP